MAGLFFLLSLHHVLLSGAQPAAPADPSCSRFGIVMSDTDMSGDLMAEQWAATSDDCCPLCNISEGCEGFAYFDQVCYLKGNFSGTYHQSGVVTRIANHVAGLGCPGFEAAQQDQDLAGRLLEDWYAPKSELCCVACAAKAECHGFSFLDNRCYLKGDVQGTYEHKGCLTRVKVEALVPAPSVPTNLTTRTPTLLQCQRFVAEAVDTDMSGDLIAEKFAATIDDCCPLCEEAQGCEGFAYFHQVCYLKANFSGTYHQAGVMTRISATAPLVELGCSGFGAAQQDQDLAGTLLEQWNAAKPELCCAACAMKQECQGFTFVGDRCYLKGDVVGTYNHTGCLTLLKVGPHRRLSESSIFVV